MFKTILEGNYLFSKMRGWTC